MHSHFKSVVRISLGWREAPIKVGVVSWSLCKEFLKDLDNCHITDLIFKSVCTSPASTQRYKTYTRVWRKRSQRLSRRKSECRKPVNVYDVRQDIIELFLSNANFVSY